MLQVSFSARRVLASFGMVLGPLAAAHAADVTTPPAPSPPPPPCITGSITPGLPPELADPGGARAALAAKGIQFQVNYIGEVLDNASGGMRQGAIYDNRLELCIDADLEKLSGWQGAALHANGYWIAGRGLSGDYVGNLLTVSNIEALPSTRLYEAWFEQKLADGEIAVRVGQLGADTEFLMSTYAGLFVNATFGWPGITAADLPSGGPAYPLATPGIRLKLAPSDQLSFLLGLYDGNPAGPGSGDPQERDPNGLDFRVTDPPLLIGEGQYSYNLDANAGLAGTVKVGIWDHFGTFADERFDTAGVPLAAPASNGIAQRLSGDYGVYGVVDQMIYHLPGDDPTKGVGIFTRISASPDDRNLISFYADAGINFSGIIASRPNDSFGLAIAYSQISDSVSAAEQDAVYYTDEQRPIQDYEAALELTYQAQIVPGWTVQPDFQYIFHPGGHIANPFNPAGVAIPNAAVVGVRMTINY
jgi:porin